MASHHYSLQKELQIFYYYFVMLGQGLNVIKQSYLIEKSSMFHQENDVKKLKEIIEERDETIKNLHKKIGKLERKLAKNTNDKNEKIQNLNDQGGQNNFMGAMLKEQMNKVKMYSDVIDQLTERINTILVDMRKDDSFSETTLDIQQMIEKIPVQQNIINSFSIPDSEEDFPEMNISNECNRKIEILAGLIQCCKIRNRGFKQQKKTIEQKLQEQKKYILELQDKLVDNQQIRHLKNELKEQRKQKEKTKGLLQRSQLQKNELINKISSMGLKDEKMKAMKTKEDFLQYSKELNYRIADLEKEKNDLVKSSTKDKEMEMKKYMNVLNKLKIIKDNSRMGQSFA